jgi:hypothetical protein
MQRIIDGFLYESKTIPDSWDVRTFEVNGHREISARNTVQWIEVGGAPLDVSRMGSYLDGKGNMKFGGQPTAEQVAKWDAQDVAEKEERRQNSLRASARRAKTTCRRVIKAEGYDQMLTLTYRSNQNNLELAKVHLKEWVRRMKKALGCFRYCAAPEPQKRGAVHWHVMTHRMPQAALHKGVKVKAWQLGTLIWRDVIGDYPFEGPLLPHAVWPVVTNGLCFVGGKSKNGQPRSARPMSVGQAASYVSKYILKNFEDAPEEKNRYSRSNGTAVPKSQLITLHGCSLAEVIEAAFQLEVGDVVISHTVGPWQDSYWLVTEPGSPRREL